MVEPIETSLNFAWHCRLGPKLPVHVIIYSDLQPVIGSLVGIQNPPGYERSSDLRQFYVIAELPIKGIDDGRTHSLCTLAPKHQP